MRTVITEGRAKVEEFLSPKISKELPVFYNPAMALNRDISVLLLRALGKKRMRVADILAGSGVRGIRLLRELGKGAIESMAINDGSKDAARLIKKNLILNGLGGNKKITVMNKDANLVLLESSGFDYIDVDPFGSPVPFLDAACRRISGGGILAVTATDTIVRHLSQDLQAAILGSAEEVRHDARAGAAHPDTAGAAHRGAV